MERCCSMGVKFQLCCMNKLQRFAEQHSAIIRYCELQDQVLSKSETRLLKEEDFVLHLNAHSNEKPKEGSSSRFFPTVSQHTQCCAWGNWKERERRNLRESRRCLSLRWSVTGNSLQPRSGSRVIESWQNVLVYLPPMHCCQTIYTVSHSAGERLMHLQSIYEDFCFEDSFLGNRVQTCMDELSFISAVASCKN